MRLRKLIAKQARNFKCQKELYLIVLLDKEDRFKIKVLVAAEVAFSTQWKTGFASVILVYIRILDI